jgi:hypothetical protein
MSRPSQIPGSDHLNNCSFIVQEHLVGQSLLIFEVSLSHSPTPHSVGLERVISPKHRPLPDNTRHSQESKHPYPDGIRTRNVIKRAAADPCLRPRGHWNRPS